MGIVLQYSQRSYAARQQRWERLERAEQFARYGERTAHGMSQRQAAQMLDVPRSTLQAWRTYQEHLDEHPAGHCQLKGKSLVDAFSLRKADGVQVAKIEEIVQRENYK